LEGTSWDKRRHSFFIQRGERKKKYAMSVGEKSGEGNSLFSGGRVVEFFLFLCFFGEGVFPCGGGGPSFREGGGFLFQGGPVFFLSFLRGALFTGLFSFRVLTLFRGARVFLIPLRGEGLCVGGCGGGGRGRGVFLRGRRAPARKGKRNGTVSTSRGREGEKGGKNGRITHQARERRGTNNLNVDQTPLRRDRPK